MHKINPLTDVDAQTPGATTFADIPFSMQTLLTTNEITPTLTGFYLAGEVLGNFKTTYYLIAKDRYIF